MNVRLPQSLDRLRHELASKAWLIRLYSYVPRSLQLRHGAVEDDSVQLGAAEPVRFGWPADIKKPVIGLIKDDSLHPFWTKYRRFCQSNAIPFGFLRLHDHDWLEQAQGYDMVVGHPSSSPSGLEEIWRKTYILERWLGKWCYPSTQDLALYEDKHLQYCILQMLEMPVIPTWVSYDETDAMRLAGELEYPLVSKLITSAGSQGVELLRDQSAAKRVIQKVFSERGRYWCWPYLRQKDYVFFQKFIATDGYDVRVICLGDMMFGYYRKARRGDFRASGSGICEKRALPESILRIAHCVAEALQAPYLSVDFLLSTSGEQFITEVAHFNEIETAEQLHVDGVPGVYVMDAEGSIRFKPGRFWVQELALKRVCEQYIRAHRAGGEFRKRPAMLSTIRDEKAWGAFAAGIEVSASRAGSLSSSPRL